MLNSKEDVYTDWKEIFDSVVKSVMADHSERDKKIAEGWKAIHEESDAFKKRWWELFQAGRIRVNSQGYILMNETSYNELCKLSKENPDVN